MQDPTAAFQVIKPQFPEQEQHLKCPRCDSTNTKFCYYNNYNLTQPRHFCKNCRRYWTKGGVLRNIVAGAGTRKNSKRSSKRSNSAASSTSTSTSSAATAATSSSLHLPKVEPISAIYTTSPEPDHQKVDINGSFSSLLASTGYFLESFHSVSPGSMGLPSWSGLNLSMCTSAFESQSSGNGNEGGANPPLPPEDFLGLQGDANCCIDANGWADTPGSRFQ